VRGVSRNDRLFITILEYLSGGSLQNRMAQPMELNEFMVVADQICDAMVFAHSNRIVHGNLRPHNILFDDTNTVKVMDFGFEPHYEEAMEENWYKAPGESASTQADVFAAGVIFYQLLAGSLPEWKRGLLQPCEPFANIPQHLRTLIKGMLCLESNVRIQTFEEVKNSLHLAEQNQDDKTKTRVQQKPGKSRRRSPLRNVVLATALLVLLGANGALYMWIFAHKGGSNPNVDSIMQFFGLNSTEATSRDQPGEEKEFVMQRVDRTKTN